MNPARVRWLGTVLVLGLAVLMGGGCNPPPPVEVVAVPVAQPPTLDGQIDALWKQAPEALVPIKGGTPGKITVRLRALYTPTHLYFLCQWPDSTESVAKEPWHFDGVRWSQDTSIDEDGFGFLFPIGSARAQFAKRGCQRYCHNDFMATRLPRERADLWHWRAALTNPVGQLDDKYLVYATSQAGGGGIRADARERKMILIGDLTVEATHYFKNLDARTAQPAFMPDPHKVIADPRFLRVEDVVPLAPDAEVTTLPGYVLGAHRGSRGDVRAQGRYANGEWILEIERALDTGHEDDIAFDLSRQYPFGISVVDNAPPARHSWSSSLTLIFQPQAVQP